jgi:predicted transposase YbfD/YdcC
MEGAAYVDAGDRRVTSAQQETCAPSALAQLPDPRAARGRRHPWPGLLLALAVGLLTGANSQHGIVRHLHNLGQAKLRKLGLRRAPSQPTLHRVLCTLDLDRFESVVSSWLSQLQTGWRVAATTWLDGIAIDGKTLRGARRLGAADGHLLSAWSCTDNRVLAQLAVPDKTNELGAIVPFLKQLALSGRTVTFDAEFTQWAVAQAVLAGGGAYLMVVKGNQPTLRRDISEATGQRGRCTEYVEQSEIGHGRIEQRSLWVAPATAVREHVLGFPGARQILEIRRRVVCKRTGQVKEETSYAVTSLGANQADAPALLRLWRGHWQIENCEHWVRDVVFAEDRATTRTGQAPQAFAALRNLVISFIHQVRGSAITASRDYCVSHPAVLFRQLGVT